MYSLVSLFYFLARCGGRLPHEVLRHFGFYIHLFIETLKLPAQLWYKICIFYVDHTSKTTGRRKKCCEYYGPEGVCILVGTILSGFYLWYHQVLVVL